MKNKEDLETFEKPLTVREKITIYLCFMMIKIVKPSNYSHEWSDIEDNIVKEINK